MNEQNIKLEFDLDFLNILEQDDDVSIVQLDLLHLGQNRNKCNISKESFQKSLPSFYNKPIIYRLNNKYFIGESTDVVEHARDEEQEKTVFIAGSIPESSSVEYVDRNDKTYVRMIGIIHKLYQPTLIKILESRKGEVKVSIELKVIDGYQDENGILVINEFKFLSVCLLGEGILEGIEGSQMIVTKFSLEDYNSHYLAFTLKNNINNNENDSFKIPDIIKNNAKKGLDFKKQYGRGMTSIESSLANYLIKNDYIDYKKIKKIFKCFSCNDLDTFDNNEEISNNFICFNGLGGNEGKIWVSKIIDSKEKNKVNKQFSLNEDELEKFNVIEIDNKPIDLIEKENLNENEEEDDKVIKEAVEKFSLSSNQIYSVLNNAISSIKYKQGDWEYCKYWVSDYDENFVLLYDDEEGKKYQVPYSIENEIATLNFDEKKEAINGKWQVVGDESTVINSENKEEFKNKPEPEKEPEDKIENSEENKVDWKAKFEALEADFTATKNELEEIKNAAKKAEDEQKMCNLLEEFSHCFSEEEKNSMKDEICNSSYEDFEAKVDNKIKEFAKKAKDKKDENLKEDPKENKTDVKENDDSNEEKEVKNKLQFSVSPFGVTNMYDFSKNLGENGLDSIIKNSGVKLK